MSATKQQPETEPANGQIFALIPRVMGEVGHISKGRKNAQQGYSFRGVDDVYAAFQGPLAKQGLFYIPEVLERESTERPTKSGGMMVYTTLTVAYTFFAPDGSSVRAVVIGEAMDSGDKSANKAMSAALKYALLQIFCVPVEASDDADAETHELAPRQRAGLAPPLRSPATPDERCEATARQPVSAEPSQPQGTIIPNQLEWLKDRLGDNLDAASEERFGRPARMLSLQEAGDWIKELGKSKPTAPAATHNAHGFHFEDATAKTMADLVTPKQITAIRAIANAAGLNAETICLDACKCRPEELSRAAASAFIDFLKSKTAEAK